jgi:hypothetical protein
MWSAAEQSAIQPILVDLQKYKAAAPQFSNTCIIKASDADRMSLDLADTEASFIARRAMEHLGCDEKLPFRWNLDHKLFQSLILHHYLPSLAPVTFGLSRAYIESGAKQIESYLQDAFLYGYVLKATRGSGTNRQIVLDSAAATLPTLPMTDIVNEYDGTIESERFMVQEKFVARQEYRVHTIGRSVIPTLIFRTWGSNTLLAQFERGIVERAIQEALSALPDALSSDLVCGWDVGIDSTGRLAVFEINYPGLHPVCRPGYQCSWFLQDPEHGPLNTARLLTFLETARNVSCQFIFEPPSSRMQSDMSALMYRVSRWRDLLQLSNKIFDMHRDSCIQMPYAERSLRDTICANEANVWERLYVEYLDWLKKMTNDLR